MKLQSKFFISFFTGFYFLFLLAFGGIYWTRVQEARQSRSGIFERAITTINAIQRQEEKLLRVSLQSLLKEIQFKDITANDAPQSVKNALQNQRDHFGYDVWFLLDSKGKVLAGSWDYEDWKPAGLEARFKAWANNGEDLVDSGLVGLKDRVYRIVLSPVKNSNAAWLGIGAQMNKENLLNIQQSVGLLPIYTYVSSSSLRSISTNLPIEEKLAGALFSLPESAEKAIEVGDKKFHARSFPDDTFDSIRLTLLMPQLSYLEDSTTWFAFFIIGTILTILISMGYSGYVYTKFSNSFEVIIERVREFASGKFENRIPATSKDSFGALATSLNEMAQSLNEELSGKEKFFKDQKGLHDQLITLNEQLSRELFENRLMLSLWKEAETLESKAFLSVMLELLLQGLSFSFGCIIMRSVTSANPEVVLARVEKDTESGKTRISPKLQNRSERTRWTTTVSPGLERILLDMDLRALKSGRLILEEIEAPIEPGSDVKMLHLVSLGMSQGNVPLGSLHLISDAPDFQLESSDKELLLSIGSQARLILENRSLQHFVRIDPLTGLSNRGYFDDRVTEEIMRSSRTKNPLTLLMMDVDFFKQVNDKFGHQGGDEVLVSLSELLKKSCRASDVICRYGGEEIAILLVDTSIDGGKSVAENLRSLIEKMEVKTVDGKIIKVTVSIGVATYTGDSDTQYDLIRAADHWLYKAKNTGRNKWMSNGIE